MILDAHCHLDNLPWLGWSLDAELLIARMDEAGVDRAVATPIVDLPNLNPNALDWIEEAVARFQGRIVGFPRIHPWYGERALAILDEALGRRGMKGLKLHPTSSIVHPADGLSVQLIRRAAEYGAPTLFHCGDDPLTAPLALAQAAARCPQATILAGHMGGYFHGDAMLEVAERHPNLLLETSAMPSPARITEAVRRLGADRVVFGSDGPVGHPRLEVYKVQLAGLSAADEALVLGGTMERILAGVRS
jgi:predicted TIM-barrel fold metal-dependent hydrolase